MKQPVKNKGLLFLFLLWVNTLQAQQVVELRADSTWHDSFAWQAACSQSLTNNFNGADYLRVNTWTWNSVGCGQGLQRTLIRFNLDNFPANSLLLDSAVLELYYPTGYYQANTTGNNALYIRKVTGPWDESTLNWSNMPGSTTLGQVSVPAATSASQNYKIDITGLVRNWLCKADSNYGISIQLQSEVVYRCVAFASSEHADPLLRPRLRLRFHKGAPYYTGCSDSLIKLYSGLYGSIPGGATFTWKDESGAIIGGGRQISTPRPDQPTTYYLEVEANNMGCTYLDSIRVFPFKPFANAGADGWICPGDSFRLFGSGGIRYQWLGPSLSNDTLPNPWAKPAVTTTYKLAVENDSGCTGYDSVTVNIYKPRFAQAGPDQNVCPGDSVLLLASGGSTCEWIAGEGIHSPLQAQTWVKPTKNSTYIVKVTRNTACFPIDYDTVKITVLKPGTLDAGPDVTVCENYLAQLKAITSGSFKSFEWSGPGFIAYPQSPITSVRTDTSAVYVLRGQDYTGCWLTDSVRVNVLKNANAGNDTTICNGTGVFLNGSGSGRYLWRPIVAISNDTVAKPFVNPSKTTTYVLTTFNHLGCVSYDTVVVTVVKESISITVGNTQKVCMGDSAQLMVSGAQFYEWFPKEGLSNPFVANPKAAPGSTTVYTVTAHNGTLCKVSKTQEVTIDSTCCFNCNVQNILNAGLDFCLPLNKKDWTDKSQNRAPQNISAEWTHDQDQYAESALLFNGSNDSLLYTGLTASPSFSMTAWVNGVSGPLMSVCNNNRSSGWTMDLSPGAWSLRFPGNGLPDKQLSVSGTNGNWGFLGLTYDGNLFRVYWNGSLLDTLQRSGLSLTGPLLLSLGYDPFTNSFYSGKLDAIRYYQTPLSEFQLSMLQFKEKPFRVSIQGNETICYPNSLTLSVKENGLLKWLSGPGITPGDSSRTLVVQPDKDAFYVVQLEQGACVAIDTHYVKVIPPLIAPLGQTQFQVCLQDSITLSALHLDSIIWLDALVTNPFAKERRILADRPQTITFRYRALGQSCLFEDSVQIIPVTPPAPNAGPDLYGCLQDSFLLQNTGAGINAYWMGPGINNPSLAKQWVPALQDTFYVLRSESITGCYGYDTLQVYVTDSVRLQFSTDSMFCEGDPIYIPASGGIRYTWNGVEKQPPYTAIAHQDENILLRAYWGSCYAEQLIPIRVIPRPRIRISVDTLRGEVPFEIRFKAENWRGEYLRWDFGDSTYSELPDPVHAYAVAGRYPLRLYVSNALGCDTSYLFPEIIRAYNPYRVFVPNAFTPNGDLKNPLFRPSLMGVTAAELQIYSTWGQLIYQADMLNQPGWDGTLRGEPLQTGVYFYQLFLTKEDGQFAHQQGVIHLLR